MRNPRLLAIPLFLLLVLLLPAAPRVSAQCDSYTTFNGGTFYYIAFTTEYAPGAAVWWRTGDFYGYSIAAFSPSGGLPPTTDIHYYDSDGVYQGILHTFTTNASYMITVHTDAIAVVASTPFEGDFCVPLPTPTPTPTLTFTPTATEVIVTVTPSPTSTPNPSIALQERVDQTFSLQVFVFTVMLGIGIYIFLRFR